MNIHSSDRLKCPDYFKKHKKCVYKTAKVTFFELNDLAEKVTSKFPHGLVKSSDRVCHHCYNLIKNMKMESQEINNSEQGHDIDDEEMNVIENESVHEDFRPSTPELISEINSQILSLPENNVSPLKSRYKLNNSSLQYYISRKRTEIVTSFSDVTNAKLQKIYHVSNDEPTTSTEPSCNDWIKNLAVALKNSSTSEKIKLLTLIPEKYTKLQILNNFPHVTTYMIDKARSMVKTKGIYSEPDIYSGHPLDEKTKDIALSYYLNDDLDCSRQSPNTRDVITVKENDEKQKVAKRFLTRSIKEIYDILKKDNPEIAISISSFYALRPKHISIGPINQVCLCIYCANFDLYLSGLQNFLEVNNLELKIIRSDVLAALVCKSPLEACFLQNCTLCPGIKGITTKVLRLPDESSEEEIIFAVWSNGELIKKTTSVSNFTLEFAKWAYKVNSHVYVKDIQRNAIKMEKENAISNPDNLVIQVDFAENWSVVVKNAIQSNHWLNKLVSIFTAVCHQGDKKKSYAVISDDCKHDSAHALLATKKIIECMTKLTEHDPTNVTIISDGAASHFKNRFQLYEMKYYGINVKRIFSATGHGKGPVDAIGGLVKHYATNHNLTKSHSETIQNATEFIAEVPKYTTAISLIYLPIEEVESFREKKLSEWKKVKEHPGIQKSHVWKSSKENYEMRLFTARTAQTPMIQVKATEKKSKKAKIENK